jgi:hypothetical protein
MGDATSVASTVRDGWLVWEVAGKPVSVRLSPDVVSRLGMAVREGFKALPRRGLETGGLLIGTKREMGNRVVVEVDDFEPVESEHAAGPSYLLSNADRRLLEARIAAREARARNTSIVGIYRSHTRRDFAITVEDASLFSSYFRKASDVFLLIKSNDGGPPTGGFIIREGGKVLSYSPYAQFPLDLTIGIPAARETSVCSVETPPAPPRAAQIVQLPAPRRTTRKMRWPIWLATAGAMALAVGLPFGIQRRIPGSIPVKPALSLALNVTNTGNGLRLSWDHQSSRHAGQAVLWIKDGPEEQRFELDSKQLKEGSVVYWPRNGDVNFRLELLLSGAVVTESVRAIGASSKAPVVAPATVVVESPAVPAVKAPLAGAEASPASVPSANTPRRDQTGAASRKHFRPFALPRPGPDSAAVGSADLPDPPTIQPVVALPPEHSKDVLKALVPANGGSRDGADSSFRVSVEPVSGSRLEHLARNIPLLGKRYRRPDYVPPAPLRNPARPNTPHRNVPRDVNIDVKVYVNPSGKVDYSEVLSKVTSTDRDLAELATFSARRWEFVPARTRDGAVPGEVILHYQFGRGTGLAGNEPPGAR